MIKSVMGIVFIVAGAVLLICGIIMVSTTHNEAKPTAAQPRVVVAGKTIPEAVSVVEEQTPSVDNQATEAPKSAAEQSKAKGNAFEDFVVNLLADWRLKLLDRTRDTVSSAGVIAESCKNPDLHVQQKHGKSEIDYFVECKYRSRWVNGEVEFKDWQLDRYRRFQRDNHRKVIIALGVGGTPEAPATFMLVPLDSVTGNSIKQIKTEFAVEPTSSAMIEYMASYFSDVFRTARNKNDKNKPGETKAPDKLR